MLVLLRDTSMAPGPRPKELAEREDEGQSLPGRWVNSHDILAGDLLQTRDGRKLRVLTTTQRYEEAFPVCNLTIDTNHSFSVGNDGLLVHNTGGCGEFRTGAPTNVRTGRYGDLASELRGTGQQANHLNQNAAFKSIIPEEEGLAHALRGNAFTEPGTPHFEFHRSLESFWNQYRRGGSLAGTRPTNAQYGQALQRALEAGGLSPAEAADLAAQAARQRAAYGLTESGLVPRIPGRLPQQRTP